MVSKSSIVGAVLLQLALSVAGQQALYGQCGGNGWSGSTECASGACCSSINPYYSQCLSGNCSPQTTPTTSVPTTSSTPTGSTSTSPASPTSTSISSGCGKSPSLNSGVITTTVAGQQRQYTLTLPQNYNSNKPYSLIFGLHWRDGTMNDVVSGNYYGLKPLSNNNVIFVAPQGLSNGWANSNGNDITFVDNILSNLNSKLCIDQTQIYSTGWSYGGAMSHALACARPDVFRAIAVMSGALLSGCSPGTKPVAYYGQHGVSDNVLPFSSGGQIRDTFVKNNGCTSQNPPAPAAGSGKHIKTVYNGCSSGHPVWWVAFDGPHEPLATDGGASSSWTPGQIWSFFSQFM